MRPVPAPAPGAESDAAEADESGTDAPAGAETPGSGYLHLLMPVRLPG
jgi:hypothetical protein